MQYEQRFLQHYFAHRACPSCQTVQRPEALFVLAQRQHTRVVMVTCGGCHHRRIFVVSLPTSSAATISQRDVRAMHSFLDTFNGDFSGLFGPSPDGGNPLAAD